jgi:hypothetical protein
VGMPLGQGEGGTVGYLRQPHRVADRRIGPLRDRRGRGRTTGVRLSVRRGGLVATDQVKMGITDLVQPGGKSGWFIFGWRERKVHQTVKVRTLGS